MSFSSTPWQSVLLLLDAGICATSLLFAWGLLRVARARGESRGWALGAVFIAGGACGLTPWIALGLWDGTIWGFCLIARAFWTGATVAVPMACVVSAVRSRRAAWLCFSAALVAFKWWGEVAEPTNLEIERVRIEVAGLRGPVRMAHFSDLQTDGIRGMERRARAEANAFDPDVVVFTGDVLNHPSLAPSVYGYLEGFRARHAKLFVGGDVDGALDRERFSKETGFEWVDGRVREVRVGNTRLVFLGFALLDYRRGGSYAEGLVRRAAKADVRIALSHRPDAAFALAGLPVPLLFTGHTHGGQVVIPGFGPPVTLTRVPRAVAAGGVHRLSELTVVLARGLGWEGNVAPRIRLFCRPHLILAELVPPAN